MISGHNKFKQCLKAEMVVAKNCLKTVQMT